MRTLKIFLGFVLCLTACQARTFDSDQSEQKMAMEFTQQVDGRDVQRVLIYFYNDMYNMTICKKRELNSGGLESVSALLANSDCSNGITVSLTKEQFETYFKIVFRANFQQSPELFLKKAGNPMQGFATAVREMYAQQRKVVDKSSGEVAWIGLSNGVLAFVSSRAAQQNKGHLEGLKILEERKVMFTHLIDDIDEKLLKSDVRRDQNYYDAAISDHILMFIRKSGLYTHTARDISSATLPETAERSAPTTVTHKSGNNNADEATEAFSENVFSTSNRPTRRKSRSGGNSESVVIDVNDPDSSKYPLKLRDYNPTNVADFYFGIIADVFSLARTVPRIERW